MYFQGDIAFIPLAHLGVTDRKICRDVPLRTTDKRLLIQEGEITGHHHGVWFVPQPTMYHDEALARSLIADAKPIVPAALYQDQVLTDWLLWSNKIAPGAPVIGFMVAFDEVTIKHASEAGVPTKEHDDIKLSAGEYLVLGKREWSAGDERRVVD